MKTLTSLILTMFMAASLSYAQGSEEQGSILLAKTDREVSTVRDVITGGEDSSDISLKSEFSPGANTDRTYESPSLDIDDLPLVISSADKKTMSIVLPPFLYFKKQF